MWSEGESAPLNAALFGMAILAAGFLLSWGAEAAEKYIAAGFIIAIVAMITVLPEYAVDFYYAYRAGQDPSSGYVAYAAANMTGANRLLIGLAWPLMVWLHWWRSKEKGITLDRENSVEFVFLAAASAYAFVIVFKNTISIIDFGVLATIFGLYLWRTSKGKTKKWRKATSLDLARSSRTCHQEPLDGHGFDERGGGGGDPAVGGAVCRITRVVRARARA